MFDNFSLPISLGGNIELPKHPEPRYQKGHKCHRYKYGFSEPQHSGDRLIECEITHTIWYSEDGRGWIYGAIAKEPVEGSDNYWNTFMAVNTSFSEQELDNQSKNIQP